jgi:hypothetical protein
MFREGAEEVGGVGGEVLADGDRELAIVGRLLRRVLQRDQLAARIALLLQPVGEDQVGLRIVDGVEDRGLERRVAGVEQGGRHSPTET